MTETEKAAYQKGYHAGRKRVKKDITTERLRAERATFRRRAFLAALPACVKAQGWQRGGTPITTMNDRVRLAWEFADEALKNYW
jgi:hypothetical protein